MDGIVVAACVGAAVMLAWLAYQSGARGPAGGASGRGAVWGVWLGAGLAAVAVVVPATGAGAAPASAAAWTIQHTPSGGNLEESQFNGVTCPTLTGCIAVGQQYDVAANVWTPLVESWTGGSWTEKATPVVAGGILSGVSCTSLTDCIAVGSRQKRDGETGALAESWNGKSWVEMKLSSSAALLSVSCGSAADCFAVGGSAILHWNGSNWTSAPLPLPAGASGSLSGLSCPSATYCEAVGSWSTTVGANRPLAEVWSGKSWSRQSAPAEGDLLAAVSCTSRTMCLAVGARDAGDRPLADFWDGSRWSVIATPNPGGWQGSILSGVSCRGSLLCTAVGSYVQPQGEVYTFAEVWDGTSWVIQKNAIPAPQSWAGLSSVSCPDASHCTAVGSDAVAIVSPFTLAERYTGG